MKRILLKTSLALALCFSASAYAQKVLFLVSSHGTEQQPEIGYDFEEFAQAYLILSAHGVDVEVASPRGGQVFGKGKKEGSKLIQRLNQNTSAMAQLNNTLKMSEVQAKEYSAAFVVGGKGAMFDLPKEAAVSDFLSHLYRVNKPIAAVCHGPAALVNVKDNNGQSILLGKRVNGFTNEEESLFGKEIAKQFPFMLEDKLKQLGGVFESAPFMLPYVAAEQGLITGQNPFSTPLVAETLLAQLGIEPQARAPFEGEATMKLLAQAKVMGPQTIHQAMRQGKDKYQVPLLGMYAFYSYKLAQSEQQKYWSVGMLEAALDYMPHPKLSLTLAQAYHDMGQIEKAKRQLAALKVEHPELPGLSALAAKLES